MRSTLLIALMVLVRVVHAQDTLAFIDTSAFWHVARTYPAGAPEDPGFTATTTRRFTIAGDSIVNGEAWSMFISEPTHPDGDPAQHEGLVRQEGELVFGLRDDLTLDTLYDFSLGIGDSTHYLIDDWYSTWLHVTALDSVLIQGIYHGIIDFDEVIVAPSVLHERWIEGIGSIHGPLFPADPITFSLEVPGDSMMLTCYGRNDSVLWDHPGYEGCEVNFLLGTTEFPKTPVLALFPNPSVAPLYLEWPVEEAYSIQVLDRTGRSVAVGRALRNRSLIDGSDLAPGCYLVVATSDSGTRAMMRWVKQ